MVLNKHILYFRLLDPQMVDNSIILTKYLSGWATNVLAISLNVGVTTFGPPCSCLHWPLWSAATNFSSLLVLHGVGLKKEI